MKLNEILKVTYNTVNLYKESLSNEGLNTPNEPHPFLILPKLEGDNTLFSNYLSKDLLDAEVTYIGAEAESILNIALKF